MALAAGLDVQLFDFDFRPDDLELQEQDRILVLAPHPDDEVLGAAGVIMDAAARDIPVHIAFLTFGDFNEVSFVLYRRRPNFTPAQVRANALYRGQEALRAADMMGLSEQDVTFLGYPDAGTMAIWSHHWGDRPRYRARLTRANEVPYASALRPGASYKGEEILQDITEVIRQFQPTKVFVSHPADHHPDHRALYLYLKVALWDLEGVIEPEVYPYLIHYPRWPQPTAYDPQEALLPPRQLEGTVNWHVWSLSEKDLEQKLAVLRAHGTQWASGSRFLRRFVRQNELFGDLPVVDPLGIFPANLESEEPDEPVPLPEMLTDEEQEQLVAIEGETIRVLDDRMILRMTLSRALPAGTSTSLYLFGWREDVPFVDMPKIHVRLSRRFHDVFDQRTRLSNGMVQIERTGNEVRVEVPLSLLDQPQRLLLNVRSQTETVPLDWAPWRAVDLHTSFLPLIGD